MKTLLLLGRIDAHGLKIQGGGPGGFRPASGGRGRPIVWALKEGGVPFLGVY